MDSKKIVEEVMKIASCPVCLERLPSDVVCCVNGHAMCKKCKKTMTECPICRKQFSEEGHTFVKQVLEVLPYPCSNKGCPLLLGKSEIEEHERLFCSQRMVKCKSPECSAWSGTLTQLRKHASHVRQGNSEIQQQLALLILEPQKIVEGVTHFDGEYLFTQSSVYYDQFFFRLQSLNSKTEKLSLHYICYPNEKAKNTCFTLKVEFKSKEGMKLTAETQLKKNYDTGTLEALLIFNSEMLWSFKDSGELSYLFSITKKQEG